ncbi:MAG TPA: hypothetical protein VIS71_06440 [Terrimicrobium sp.]
MKTVTNEESFLNPQITQIGAEGEERKQAAQELERPRLASRSTPAFNLRLSADCLRNPRRLEAKLR